MEYKKSLKPLDRDIGFKGIFAPLGTWPGTTVSAVANRGYLMRFVPSRTMSITKIAFAVTTASSVDDPCDVGIYTAELNKVVTSGSKSGLLNSTGVKTISVATILQPNVIYYAAFAWGTVGGTAAQIAGVINNSGFYGDLMGSENGVRMTSQKSAVFPLPASIAAPEAAVTPFVAVRES